MYIDKPNLELLDARQTKEHLETLLAQPTPAEIPPCPNCLEHRVNSCNSNCPEAKTALSTHPTEFPIEPNVTPLVFGLASTHITQTCWSCEGHMDSNNNLISLPRVSFYCTSVVYSQLLHRHVLKLKVDHQLKFSWQVVLTDYSQTWGQTYSIVPDLNFEREQVHLGALQNDLKVIAVDMQLKLKQLARDMVVEIDSWIKQSTDKN